MKKILQLFITLAGLISFGLHAEIAVIVDPSVKIDTITAEQLERLYLYRADRYPDKVKLVPIDQVTGSAIRRNFTQKILWKTEIEVAEYWSRRMFSGKGRPPRQFDGDDNVIQAVTSNPGTLGYVDNESVDERVKVLLLIP